MTQEVQFLHPDLAFKKGADLWALAGFEENPYSAMIDWYLGFQITKQKSGAPPLTTSPLLLESSRFLPNLWTLQISYTAEWPNTVYNIWRGLNRPSLRIFMSQKTKDKEKVANKWRSDTAGAVVQCVIYQAGSREIPK